MVESKIEAVCPVCDRRNTIEVGIREETFTIRNDQVRIEAKVRRCSSCNEYHSNVSEEEDNFQKAYRVYRANHGLLQPEEMKAIREKYDLSQRAFSQLMGWGAITMHRYEAGALQSESHNNEMILVRDPKNFSILFQRNQHKIAGVRERKVQYRLTQLLNESILPQLRTIIETLFASGSHKIESGYRSFDLERFETLVHFFCKEIPNTTKEELMLLLWFSDFMNFRVQQRSITGLVYKHAKYAPVPLHYDLCMAYLTQEKTLCSREVFREQHFIQSYFSAKEVDFNLSLLTSQERDVLLAISKHFKRKKRGDFKKVFYLYSKLHEKEFDSVITYDLASSLEIFNKLFLEKHCEATDSHSKTRELSEL